MTKTCIEVGDSAGSKLQPAALNSPILSSVDASWNDIKVEQHHIGAHEANTEFYLPQHFISIHLSSLISMEWKVNGRFQSRHMRPGDVCIAPVGPAFVTRHDEDAEVLLLTISPALVSHAAPNDLNPDRVELTAQRCIDDPQIRFIGMALKAELEAGCPAGRLFGESLATALVVHLLRQHCTVEHRVKEYSGGLPVDRLRRVVDYVKAHLDTDLSLGELAQQVGLSAYHFSRLFKQSTGKSPNQYVMRLRVEEAKRLLRETNLGVLEVALAVGYNSPSHLATQFKRITGVTPSVYRHRC